MAAVAAAGSAASIEGEFLTEVEQEVAAILLDLSSLVRARRRRPEIPTWGCRRPRTVPAAEKPAVLADRGEGAASPDTPLAFPEENGGDDGEDEQEDAAAAKKARTQAEEQRGAVASLSQENAHLLKQIEDYRARLQSSRSTNDDLKQMQSKLQLKRERQEEEDERSRKLQVETTAEGRAIDRPALGLDLNEPARAPEEDDGEAAKAKAAVVAEWCRRGQQQRAMMVHKAALTAEARRRRREIRRAKGATPIRIRRIGSS